jgi:hypothetical protein
VSAVDPERPDTGRGSEAAADSHGVRGVRLRRRRPDGGGPQAPLRATQHRRLRLVVGAGQWARSTQPAETGCPDVRTPEVAWRSPGARTPLPLRTPAAGQGTRTLAAARPDSRQQGRPPPQSCPAGRDHQVRHRRQARLTASSVAWCAASEWSAPGGSGCAPWVPRRSWGTGEGPVGSSGWPAGWSTTPGSCWA